MSKDELRSSKLRADTTDTVRLKTRIWKEQESQTNPFHSDDAWCFGYNLFELAEKKSFSEVFFLLFTGELPSTEQDRLLQHLLILFINPGPRHPATRSGVTAAASMTYEEHLLPIMVSAFGGARGGAGNMRGCMEFLDTYYLNAPQDIFENTNFFDAEECCVVGFGGDFGEASTWAGRCLRHFLENFNERPCFSWLYSLDVYCREASKGRFGITLDLIVAMVFKELNFSDNQAVGLYQLISAPGMFAHAAEYIRQPSTSIPFIADENYVLED